MGPDKFPNPNLNFEMGRNSPRGGGAIDQEGKDFVLSRFLMFQAVAFLIIPYNEIFFFWVENIFHLNM